MSVRRKKQQRVIAVLLCLSLLVMLLFCASMAAKHVLHRCCGNNCPVCEVLQNSQHALKQLALAAGVAAVLFAAPGVMLPLLRSSIYCVGNSCSLVNLKIRINH